MSGCGGTFNDMTGQITSPLYPSDYPLSVECIWDIKVPDGYHIIMQSNGIFDIAATGSGNGCNNDYVEFFSVNANGEAVSWFYLLFY